jgi:hypothetical protein
MFPGLRYQIFIVCNITDIIISTPRCPFPARQEESFNAIRITDADLNMRFLIYTGTFENRASFYESTLY